MVQRVFTHPDTDYDFTIQLKPDVLTRYRHSVAYESHKLTQQEGPPRNGPGFDPARAFFEDLEVCSLIDMAIVRVFTLRYEAHLLGYVQSIP